MRPQFTPKRFTPEQLEKANNVNIILYAHRAGYELHPIKDKGYRIPGYGGLYIDQNGSKWNCFSQLKGGGPIQFVMHMEGKSWVEAIKHLLNIEHEPDHPIYIRVPVPQKQRGKLILPEKNNTYKHVFAYLIGHRKLDKDIIYELVKQGKIYENKLRSCVFVGFNKDGEVKYASVRSTNTMGNVYRWDVENSDKAFGFSIVGKSTTLRIFEAPIDLISYITIVRKYSINDFKDHMLALGCLGDTAIDQYLKDHPDIQELVFCLDNDPEEWGLKAFERFRDKYWLNYKVSSHFPEFKDWNEQLVKFVKAQETNMGTELRPLDIEKKSEVIECVIEEEMEIR